MKRHLNLNGVSAPLTVSLITLALGLGGGCGKKDSDDSDETEAKTTGGVTGTGGGSTNDGTIDADVPSDSTGASAPVAVSFATAGAGGGALMLQAAPTIALAGGITVTDARVNVGAIKIKADKAMSSGEKALRQTLKAEKQAMEKEIEADKEALETEKEAIETTYKPQFEAATTEQEKEALKVAMKAEFAGIEARKALIEAKKDAAMAALEAAKDKNMRWKGPYVYDLVLGTVTPELPAVELTDGSYRRIEFKVHPNRDLPAEDALLNHSVHVAGTVTVNSVEVPFAVSIRTDEEIKLMGAGAFKVQPAVTNALTIAFNPATWFTGVDLSAGTKDMTGTIVVDTVSNPTLYEAIRKNIKSSTEFGKDEDGDGKLGASESEGDGAEGVTEEEAESESESESES